MLTYVFHGSIWYLPHKSISLTHGHSPLKHDMKTTFTMMNVRSGDHPMKTPGHDLIH